MPAKNSRKPNRRELTDMFIRGLPVPERKIRWRDTKQGGLCLEVQPTGHKSFKVCYRSGNLLRWYHIDAYGAVYLKEARKAPCPCHQITLIRSPGRPRNRNR